MHFGNVYISILSYMGVYKVGVQDGAFASIGKIILTYYLINNSIYFIFIS